MKQFVITALATLCLLLTIQPQVLADPPPPYWALANVNANVCSGPTSQQRYTGYASASTDETNVYLVRLQIMIADDAYPSPNDSVLAENYNNGNQVDNTLYKLIPFIHHGKYLYSIAEWNNNETANSWETSNGMDIIPESSACCVEGNGGASSGGN